MLKKLVVTLVAGAALAGGATAALAHGSWDFDDPYWQQLDRTKERSSIGSRGADRYAAGVRDTLTDASGESRLGDSEFVTQNEAEKKRLDRAGFPQYSY